LSIGIEKRDVCSYCGKVIDGLPYKCHYCEETFCPEHRLPENHFCMRMPRRSWDTYRERKIGIKVPLTWNIAKKFAFSIFLIGVIMFWISLLAPYLKWSSPEWIREISIRVAEGGVMIFCGVIMFDFIFWKLRRRRYFVGHLTPKLVKAIFWISVSTIFSWGVLEGYVNTVTCLSAVTLAAYLDYRIFKKLARATNRIHSDEGLYGMMILAGFISLGSLIGAFELWLYCSWLPFFSVINYNPFGGYIPLEGTALLSLFFLAFLAGLTFVGGFLEFRFMRRVGIIIFPR